MKATGIFTNAEIARRLQINEKTVRRALEDCFPVPLQRGVANTDEEKLMWWVNWVDGDSCKSIAFRFGVTRQYVDHIVTNWTLEGYLNDWRHGEK